MKVSVRIQPLHHFQAGLLLEPGNPLLPQPRLCLRRDRDQGGDLALDHRHQHQQQGHDHQHHRREHQHHAGHARAAGGLDAVDQRVAQPGQRQRQHEEGDDRPGAERAGGDDRQHHHRKRHHQVHHLLARPGHPLVEAAIQLGPGDHRAGQ
ncbi:hypothetical protein G6F60_014215 [Rhizopus arrhizus]|nr:hypothetical protein G6F60_014215 [Rhizopus arrhizus]